jgi:hypothetical protein
MPPMDHLPPPDAEVLALCEQVAAKMPLVHVTSGRAGRPMLWDIAGGEIPTSETEHAYCGPTTRFVEGVLGFQPSVYFYAGRAHPRYGDVALAYLPEVEQGMDPSATPFDSGGVARDDGRGFRFTLPGGMSRADFARASVVGAAWRSAFARWLAAYYPSGVEGYWERPPEREDPDGLYSPGNDWAAWVWEVRLPRGPVVTDAVAWATDLAHLQEIREFLDSGSPRPEVIAAFDALFEKLINPTGRAAFHQELERWVRRACE